MALGEGAEDSLRKLLGIFGLKGKVIQFRKDLKRVENIPGAGWGWTSGVWCERLVEAEGKEKGKPSASNTPVRRLNF